MSHRSWLGVGAIGAVLILLAGQALGLDGLDGFALQLLLAAGVGVAVGHADRVARRRRDERGDG